MTKTKYTGKFVSDDAHEDDGHTYEMTTTCYGFIQAFILLTAKAIKAGEHYQLARITSDEGSWFNVDDIAKIGRLLK